MVKLKNTIRLSLLATVILSSGLYSEEYYHGNEREFPQEGYAHAPEKESIDISHTLIQNMYALKNKRKKVQKSKNSGEEENRFSSLIIMDSEKSEIEQGIVESSSSAFKLTYNQDASNNSDMGALFSYRNTKYDKSSAKSEEFFLAPYYKYYKDITDNIDIETVANLLVGTREFSGSTPSFDSYQSYGGGLTVIPGFYIGERVMFNFPVGVQGMQRSASSGDDELQNFLNYGVSGELKIMSNWFINANFLKTKDLESDNNLEATYYVVQSNYYGEYWNFGLGYKTVEDVKNYTEDTVMLSILYNW
jgi:hypothetical protein